jgi:hypothetical protein
MKVIHVYFMDMAGELVQSITSVLSPSIPVNTGLWVIGPSSAHLLYRSSDEVPASRYHAIFSLLEEPIPTVHKVDILAKLYILSQRGSALCEFHH